MYFNSARAGLFENLRAGEGQGLVDSQAISPEWDMIAT